ncbi:MAG TPA: basic secretory protein-like protein [Chthonomonadaceae bacterium]|nr:basic secretory protein-like protein [Chthonomonadaceae bacterium]
MKRSYAMPALLVCLCLGVVAPAQEEKRHEPRGDAGETHYQIEIDYSQTPQLKQWAERELHPTLEKWYPIILADLPTDGFTPPQRYTITLEANGKGVAVTSGTRVTVNAKWIEGQLMRGPKNETLGALVHESVHVAQQYGEAKGHNRAPVWLAEGIADYIRWWKYETAATRRPFTLVKPNGDTVSYTDGYHTTAEFLEYLAKNYDHEIVVKLNTAGRMGTYTPDLWKEYTGKTIDELWAEFIAIMARKVEGSSK